jgi:hypothetical protein
MSRGDFERRLSELTDAAVAASLESIGDALASRYGSDRTAWLIEETWSGFVHYLHRDFEPTRWRAEANSLSALPFEWAPTGTGGWLLTRRKPSVPFITKDANEAMHFASAADAHGWLAAQPPWLSCGDQYQPREHMWPAPSGQRNTAAAATSS